MVAAISKRPDTNPLTDLLAEKGDEIFKDCDGIAIELDLEKDTVKQVLYFAQKYHKKVYAAVSNMSIAMELFAANRLFCLQPAGSGDPVF